MRAALYRQFGRPSGPLGHLAGWIMARRPSNWARNRWAVELLDPCPGERVLEIGSGPGLSLVALASRIGTGRVVGLDHSDVMLRQAHRRVTRAGMSARVDLWPGGLERLGQLAVPFDRACSVNVVQFWSDRRDALSRIHRALRSGAVLVTLYQPRHRGATRRDAEALADELLRDVAAAGFREPEIHWLELRPVPAVALRCRA